MDTCYCWARCCRSLWTASWGRSGEGSRGRISSGKGQRLSSGGRSAEDCLLLLVQDKGQWALEKGRTGSDSYWTRQDGFGSRLTDAVFRNRHIPLRGCKLLLALRAAAVAWFRHRAAGQEFGQQGGPPVVQLPINCQNKRSCVTHTAPSAGKGKVTAFKQKKTHISVSAGVWSSGWWWEGGELWKWSSYAVCSPVVLYMAAPENWGQELFVKTTTKKQTENNHCHF